MERSEYINYISKYVSELTFEEKKKILTLIMSSDIEDHKIREKGSGTEIKYKDIPDVTLQAIYKMAKDFMTRKQKELNEFTVDTVTATD
jgi:hypothetical protein